VFDSQALRAIRDQHLNAFRTLALIRKTLIAEFDGLDDAILALVLSVVSGEPLLIVGPPGTAKSRLIRRFCTLVAIDPKRTGQYFEYLLTPFTEPTELWGHYDPAKLLQGELTRVGEEAMMQSARVVFLDEVFKGSSAILNSLLPFMNERVFFDRGKRREVKLECLFAATNELPDSAELQAVADRFALRCRVDNAEADPKSLNPLLQKGWPLTYGPERNGQAHSRLLDELKALRSTITNTSSVFRSETGNVAILAQLVQTAREYGLSRVSNRRLIKCLYVMLLHRMFADPTVVGGDIKDLVDDPADDRSIRTAELRLLPRYFLDDVSNDEAVRQMEAALTS
jgi:MoxR-like ATPase